MSNTTPFLHIAYANNNTGTLDFTTTGGIKRTHTGFYTDEYSTDSSDPTKYKWLTNEEFTNKVNTAAYANSADGTDGFTTVYPNLNLGDNTKTFAGADGATSSITGSIRLDSATQKTQDGDFNYLTYKPTKDNSDWFRFFLIPDTVTPNMTKVTVKPNTKYTFSVWLKGTGQHTIYAYQNWTAPNTTWSLQVNLTSDWKLYTFTVTSNTVIPAGNIQFFIRSNNGTEINLKKPKVEEGSTATPWMPSASEVKDSDYPQYIGFSNIVNPTTFKDYEWTLLENIPKKILNTHVAYAYSADGTDGFTTVYPNLNLLTGTSTKVVQATDWNMQVANIKYDKSLGEALCASVMINNADHASVLVQGSAKIVLETLDQSGNVLATIDGNNVSYNASGLSWCSISINDNTASARVFIFTNNMNKNAFYSCLKIEPGSTATPWMPSSSEVTTADWPKYIGVYGDDSTTASQVPASYKWSSITTPGPTPPVVDDIHILTMPTVKSINVTYGIGTVTTKPTSWLSAKPKLDVNQVLWYKSEITGTDDSVGVYYSNAIGGANLDDGDSPLDNTAVSIVLNDKIVNIPHDLALKLDLLAQVSDKRDNELAQAIADTNDRITNIDMITGLEGLEQERTERKAGDEALKTQITTNLGTETDHYNQLTARLVENEAKSGRSIIQGTAFVGSNEPSIFLDHINKKAFLRYQIPGDISYQVKEIEFNYETGIEFRDELSLLVWSKDMSDKYGSFSWRDTIVNNSDTDTLYLTGINSLFLLDGSLLIRGEVYFSDASEAIGNMNNRGFLAKYANIVVAPDAKSVKSIRLIGKMGVVTESFSIDTTATWTVERYDNVVTITSSPKLDTNTTTAGSWVNLSQKVPYGLRPKSNKEISCGVITTNNLFMIGVGSNGALKYHQATSNANKYIAAGGISWVTFNEYLPQTWKSNTKWIAR